MDYNSWFSGDNIPTVRRLDYVVSDTDGMESGFLYARLRKMTYLKDYNNSLIPEKNSTPSLSSVKSLL